MVHENGIFGCTVSDLIFQSNDFSYKRSLLETRRKKTKKFDGLDLPQPECASKWKLICLEQRLPEVEIPLELEASFAHHKGTPPTLRFVLSLSDLQVNSLIQHLIDVCFFKRNYLS